MKQTTVDIAQDEMIIMAVLLGQFIERTNKILRNAGNDNDAEQARRRLEIATRLRGKLPLVVSHVSSEDTE